VFTKTIPNGMLGIFRNGIVFKPCIRRGGAIFDVGCGLGLFLDSFENTSWRKYGVDVSDYAVRKARARGISIQVYEKGYDYPNEYFDVIVFRGTIQHLDTPFFVVKRCVDLLKKGGLMAFLSTPNANSICYKLFGSLAFLSSERNFWIPSDITLPIVLKNFGLTVVEVRHPYLETPYARPLHDHLCFLLRCMGVQVKFAFWGNIIECFARKDCDSI